MYFWCVTSHNERDVPGTGWRHLAGPLVSRNNIQISTSPRKIRQKYVHVYTTYGRRIKKKNEKRGKTVAFIIQRIYSRLCLYARGPRRDFFLYICMYFLLFTFAKISFSYLCADLWYRTFFYIYICVCVHWRSATSYGRMLIFKIVFRVSFRMCALRFAGGFV